MIVIDGGWFLSGGLGEMVGDGGSGVLGVVMGRVLVVGLGLFRSSELSVYESMTQW